MLGVFAGQSVLSAAEVLADDNDRKACCELRQVQVPCNAYANSSVDSHHAERATWQTLTGVREQQRSEWPNVQPRSRHAEPSRLLLGMAGLRLAGLRHGEGRI